MGGIRRDRRGAEAGIAAGVRWRIADYAEFYALSKALLDVVDAPVGSAAPAAAAAQRSTSAVPAHRIERDRCKGS